MGDVYTVYKTTCLVNSKIYVGVHKTENPNDEYLGSGKILSNAIAKYGRSQFVKEILHICDSAEEAFLLESKIVNEDFIKDENTYNIKLGGDGGWDYINKTGLNVNSIKEETKIKISKAQKNRYNSGVQPWNKGLKFPGTGKSNKTRLLNGISFAGKNNPMYGKDLRDILSPEEVKAWGERISKANKGKIRTDEAKLNYSKAAKSRKWLIHKSGKLASTIDPNDFRFNHPDWQTGRKWK